MKRYSISSRTNTSTQGQSVVDYLMWAQDRRHAVNKICEHNQKPDTVKLNLNGNIIYSQRDSSSTPVNIHYSSSMEINAINAINAYSPRTNILTTKNIVPPSISIIARSFEELMKLYKSGREKEKEILQNMISSNGDDFFTEQKQELKNQLIGYKTEYLKKCSQIATEVQDHSILVHNESIQKSGQVEIDWIKNNLDSSYYSFFNSKYVRSFGFVVNDESEDETMLQELRTQLEQMRRELENKNNALRDKDQIIADKDQVIVDKDQIIADQQVKIEILTSNLGIQQNLNEDLTLKLIASKAEVVPLQEKVSELKIENKELKDEKTELRAEKRILFEEKKITLDEKKLLLEEKKYYFDLSIEQASKITLLEQIHCNDPLHEFLRDNETPLSGENYH